MPKRSNYPAVNVKEVPPEIGDAVEADAQERNVSVADAIGEAIADYYGVPWEHSGYPYTGTTGATQWVIRLPEELKALIYLHAKRTANAQRGIILFILSRHYGLAEESPRKRGARKLDDDLIRSLRERHAAGESIRSLHRATGGSRESLTKALRVA